MPATPSSGQITFDDIVILVEDEDGYEAPAGIGVQELALRVRNRGQAAPPNYPNNIAFSDFRKSTVISWRVSSTPETASQYYGNNNDGTISVSLKLSSFKTGDSGITAGKKGIYVSVPGDGLNQTIYTTGNGTQTLTFGGGGGAFNSDTYTVTVIDLVTNATTTKDIFVGYV